MITQALISLFKRDLNKLIEEIELYEDESKLWIVSEDISNSAGNLCLHLVGNLNTFIGANLGNTGYIRERDKEFSLKNVPVKTLKSQVEDVIIVIENTLNNLTQQDLEKEYTHRVFEKHTTTAYFVLHLAMHLAYHLGQINYHRRLMHK